MDKRKIQKSSIVNRTYWDCIQLLWPCSHTEATTWQARRLCNQPLQLHTPPYLLYSSLLSSSPWNWGWEGHWVQYIYKWEFSFMTGFVKIIYLTGLCEALTFTLCFKYVSRKNWMGQMTNLCRLAVIYCHWEAMSWWRDLRTSPCSLCSWTRG